MQSEFTLPIRILLAEDHALVRTGTRRILEQHEDLRVVGEASDGRQVLELVDQLRPDVVLLDIGLPGLSGLEVARALREKQTSSRVLVLTAHDDDDYVIAMLDAGAMGYFLKTAEADDLVEAIRAVHRAEAVLHPAITAKLGRLWRRRGQAHREPGQLLSPREREVLELAARGYRNQAIAGHLFISIRTVEGHFNSILSKLGASTRVEAVLFAVARGWVSPEDEG
ncbi:MAG: response regulator transcription factor [Chloroflexi bacterium]|nr:response regulator transcription factor [Chloroflexota bacterium]